MTSKTAQSIQSAGRPVTPPPDHLGLERLIFFSDAVFAIAITLLALDIHLPPDTGPLTNAQLLHSLLALWPKYLGYVISFLVIGRFWLGHHRKFRFIERYDHNLLMLNLLLLLVVAFIPFPTAVLSDYGNQTATIFYALTGIGLSLSSAATWWYASYHNRLISPYLNRQLGRHELMHSLIPSGVFLLSIGLAFINADLAKYSWLLIPLVSRFV